MHQFSRSESSEAMHTNSRNYKPLSVHTILPYKAVVVNDNKVLLTDVDGCICPGKSAIFFLSGMN